MKPLTEPLPTRADRRRAAGAAAGLALLLAAPPATADVPWKAGSASAKVWSDPAFQRQLVRSFAPLVEVEPIPEAVENEYHNSAVRLVGSDPAEARRLLLEGIETGLSDQGEALFQFTLGTIHFTEGRRPEAGRAFLRAIELYPNFRRARKNLGIIYAQAGKHGSAVRQFAKVIELGEVDGTLYGLLGGSYNELGRFTEAETAFRQAMMLNPESEIWKLGLVRALFEQEKFQEAGSLVESMLAASPDDATLWNLQASAFIGKKEFLDAAKNFEVLYEMGALGTEELNTLGDIYANETLLRPAMTAYLRAFESDPSSITAPLRAAEVLVQRDGADLAKELIKRVRTIAGTDLSKDERLRMKRVEAQIDFSQGNDAAGAAALEEVVREDPLDGRSLVRLGEFYAAGGDNDRAIRNFELGANIDEVAADANVRHGQLLVSMGDYEAAIPLLRRSQELRPRDAVRQFLEDLEEFVKRRGR